MSHAEQPVTIEQLLEHTEWVEALARRLVRDDATAEDVVQETWFAVLRRPPRFVHTIRPWLAGVVRNFAARAHREEYRRVRRERLVARSESVSEKPDELLQWAELQFQIVDAVRQLSEPFRSTVLLRFFANMNRREIAEKEGVSTTTVGSRINTALDRLRHSLDRAHGGDYRAWRAIIIPCLGLKEMAAPAASAALTTSAGGFALSLSTIGGIVMAQKTVIVVGLIALMAGAIGVGIGRTTAPQKPLASKANPSPAVEKRYQDLHGRYETTARALGEAKQRLDEFARQKQALEQKLAALNRKLAESARHQAAEETAEQASLGGVEWAKLTKLLGEAVGIQAEAEEYERQGQPQPKALRSKLGYLLHQIMSYGLKLRSEVDYPLLDRDIFNRFFSALLKDPLGLSEDQLKQLAESHETLFDDVLGPIDPATLFPLERYRLKCRLVDLNQVAIEGILDENQLKKWNLLARVSEDTLPMMFGTTPFQRYGLQASGIEQEIVKNWQKYFPMSSFTPGQKEAVEQIASDYVKEARGIIEQYGINDDAIKSLSPEFTEKMNDNLLDLQERTEAQFLPLFAEKQIDDLRQRKWIFVHRFNYSGKR